MVQIQSMGPETMEQHGRLNDTELALAGTVAELIEKLPLSTIRNEAMVTALLAHGPVIMEAVLELRDVRNALAGCKERIERSVQASNAFSEPLASIHDDLSYVLDKVRFVLRD